MVLLQFRLLDVDFFPTARFWLANSSNDSNDSMRGGCRHRWKQLKTMLKRTSLDSMCTAQRTICKPNQLSKCQIFTFNSKYFFFFYVSFNERLAARHNLLRPLTLTCLPGKVTIEQNKKKIKKQRNKVNSFSALKPEKSRHLLRRTKWIRCIFFFRLFWFDLYVAHRIRRKKC